MEPYGALWSLMEPCGHAIQAKIARSKMMLPVSPTKIDDHGKRFVIIGLPTGSGPERYTNILFLFLFRISLAAAAHGGTQTFYFYFYSGFCRRQRPAEVHKYRISNLA